ncbi:MAG: hypothetical protein COW58_11430 [Thalassolituus sp. CG17_big_fil_post_rev_8_21_14_2_50_53_8]|nr:MAG: hypothetical protein COW58_11430 [Thalassolituus sp. CG17_big_fil_post_rev_8_21_14_2_50_53_8]
MSDKRKILEKIRKCLALAKSSNPHEAAAALRQAQKLMAAHKLSEQDIDLLSVKSARANAGRAQKPPKWQHMLVGVICEAFSVEAIFRSGFFQKETEVEFIGIEEAPEVASYAYDVLRRQLTRDRAEHVRKQKRCKPATKSRRGDLFAEQWVVAVYSVIADFISPVSEKHKTLIAEYKNKNHAELKALKPKEHSAKGNDLQSQNEGYRKGKEAQLNRGMTGTKRELLEAL